MLTVPVALHPHLEDGPLAAQAQRASQWRSQDFTLREREITDDVLTALAVAATEADDKGFGRVVASLIAARAGDFSKTIPRLHAAPGVITAFLRHDMLDGWLYRRETDGHLHPYLVTRIDIKERTNDPRPHLVISLLANGRGSGRNNGSSLGVVGTSESFEGDKVTRKRPADILAAAGLFKETPDLRAEYDAQMKVYREVLTSGFAEQYRYTGTPLCADDWNWRTTLPRENRKVIHDIAPQEIGGFSEYAPSSLFSDDDPDSDGSGPVPIHTVLRVFDLVNHEFVWANTVDLVRYEYHPELRDKIVLPSSHRDLLDILTTDIDTLTGDIIEGKSTGNVILCKGSPGLGKTLTAEVYSELIERPLYSIHSGNLGIDAATIRKNLEEVFQRAKRWNVVLLLDEADVFVIERGESLQQNAIVAEFLRTLEYFDRLLFMTTNRADRIDEAIVSRTAAIIQYHTPDADGMTSVWGVQAANHGVTLDSDLVADLVAGFPQASPRDIKMLLRLALRVSVAHNEPLSVDLFRRCAMFRDLAYQGDTTH